MRVCCPFKTFGFLFLSFFLGSCSKDSKNQIIAKVERGDLLQRVSVSGFLKGKKSSYIYPGYAGYVVGLQVKLGDKVKEGTPLVRVAQTVDQPLSQLFPIRAPFGGVVTQVLKKDGEAVTNSVELDNAILRIDDLSEFWLDVNVPELDVVNMKLGMTAKIKPNAISNKVYTGEIKEISLSARTSQDRWDRGKVEFPVRLVVTGDTQGLKAGMSAMADIVTAEAKQSLLVPHEYIHNQDGRFFVIDTQGKEYTIEVGLSNESHVQVLSGVTEGTQLKMVDFQELSESAKSGKNGRGRSSR